MSTYVTKRAKELEIPIVDATKPLVVHLTSNEISRGKRQNSRACAYARACRTLPGVNKAYIFRGAAHLEYDDKIVRYILSPAMRKEILVFDRNGDMAPGDYTLKAPKGAETLGAATARSKKRPGRHQPANGRIRRKVVHTPNMRELTDPDPNAA
jgi:hypothetical protein